MFFKSKGPKASERREIDSASRDSSTTVSRLDREICTNHFNATPPKLDPPFTEVPFKSLSPDRALWRF
jgi:hypothetical protein